MKNSVIALVIIGVFIAGIFLGQKFVSQPTIKESTTVTKWEPWPYPVEVEIEVEKLVPVQVDPPDPEIIEKYKDVDTLTIVREFLVKNHYDLDFSQDSIGTFIAHVDVQANQVGKATATIRPVTKVVEKTTVVIAPPKTQFYMMLGSSLDFQTGRGGAGLDFRDKWMVGASVIKHKDSYGYTIDFGIKF